MNLFDEFETSSSSEDSSEDELTKLMDLIKTPSQKRKHIMRNDYSILNDFEFEMRFRLPRDMVEELVEKIRPRIELSNYRNNPISPKLQVLIALRFYATGTFQIVLGDLFGVSQKSVSRIIWRVSSAIANLADEEVVLPRSALDIMALNHEFYKIAGMPLVIGVIDGMI